MIKGYKALIKDHQASSLKRVLEESLDYHYVNFTKLERLGEPFSVRDGMKMDEVAIRMKANSYVKFEVQAYINQIRRLKHFINFLQRNGGFTEPNDLELKQVWNDLMLENGMINLLANKWAVHRSVDVPRGESENLHLQVLLNLDSTITSWANGHVGLSIGRFEFFLFDYHQKVLKFVEWVFGELENNPNRIAKSK